MWSARPSHGLPAGQVLLQNEGQAWPEAAHFFHGVENFGKSFPLCGKRLSRKGGGGGEEDSLPISKGMKAFPPGVAPSVLLFLVPGVSMGRETMRKIKIMFGNWTSMEVGCQNCGRALACCGVCFYISG